MPKKVTPAARKNAVVRVLSGKSTMEAEAARLGLTRQAVGAWVSAARSTGKLAPDDNRAPEVINVSPAASVGNDTPGAHNNSAVENALKAAGVPAPASGAGATEPGAAPAPGQLQLALADAVKQDQEFCVEAIGGIKQTVIPIVAELALDFEESDPEVEKISELKIIAREAIKANATLIAPGLRKYLAAGWTAVAVGLTIDGVLTYRQLRKLAIKRGLIEPKKKPKGEPEEKPKAEEPLKEEPVLEEVPAGSIDKDTLLSRIGG